MWNLFAGRSYSKRLPSVFQMWSEYFVRECPQKIEKCSVCSNVMEKCISNYSPESNWRNEESNEESKTEGMDLFYNNTTELGNRTGNSDNEFETGYSTELAPAERHLNLGHTPVGMMRADHGSALSEGSTQEPAPAEVVDVGGALKGAPIIDQAGE